MKNFQLSYTQIVVFICVILIGASACARKGATAQKGGKGGKDAQYAENLADFRPKYKVEEEEKRPATSATTAQAAVQPTSDVTAKVEVAMEQIAMANKNIRYAQGYRIQIYSGNNRDEANKARDRSYALFPDITPHIVYNQPTFRVKVGDFVDRLAAQSVYAGLVADFPNAIVVQDKVEIK